MITSESVERFFSEYAVAFTRSDVEAIGRLWLVPAFITAPARNASLVDADAFRRNTESLCAFYRRQGVARAAKSVLDIQPVSDGVALVITKDELFDSAGRTIAAWKHSYLIRETPGGLRAIAAVADNEVHAWAARGTPLGS